MATSRDELEKGLKRLSGGDEIWFRSKEGKNIIRFVEFPKNKDRAYGIFEEFRAHWGKDLDGKSKFFICKHQFGESCPFCDMLNKYMIKVRDEEIRDLLFSMRAKKVFITYVSENTKYDGTGEWQHPKLYVVGRKTVNVILNKFLNIIDGEFYPPDANPSYALILTKQPGNPFPEITYDLSRKVYKIPDFGELKPIIDLIGIPDYDKIILETEEFLKTKLAERSEVIEENLIETFNTEDTEVINALEEESPF